MTINILLFYTTDSYQWTTPDYSGLRPRYEHAVFQPVSQPNKIFVFGGADQGRNMNDLQVLDLGKKLYIIDFIKLFSVKFLTTTSSQNQHLLQLLRGLLPGATASLTSTEMFQ